jgi:hypothetical protein
VGRIPDPEPGLVFRYDYLRYHEAMEGVENGKERPACVLLELAPGETIAGARFFDELSGEVVVDYSARQGDVLILLIQTDPPNADQLGAKLSIDTKRLIDLRTTEESYIILSELNIDAWPNAGIKQLPHRPGEFAYPGKLPGPLLSAVASQVLKLRERKLLAGVIRHP